MTGEISPTGDPWSDLRGLTAARIALGRAGASLPTRELLDFGLAHARARDAVWHDFAIESLAQDIEALGRATLIVQSAARNRLEYLRRPDLGRTLSAESRRALAEVMSARAGVELALIVADGLSAVAAERQAPPLLAALLPLLERDGWSLAPIVLVRGGRVAIEDEIGALLGATQALILLGERPGLGAPDSLGAYLVYGPRAGASDADRNCVSNIRPEGLSPAAAAETLHYLLTESRRRKLSGIGLKDERPRAAATGPAPPPGLSPPG